MRVILTVLVSFFLVVSCTSNECTSPEVQAPTSGRAVLDGVVRRDRDGRFYTSGFSFEQGEVLQVTDPNEPVADIHLLFTYSAEGEFTGLAFSGGGMVPEFSHIARVEDAGEARAAFDSTRCIPDDAYFSSFVMPLRVYDIWAVKTVDGRFGKVLLTKTFWCKQEWDSAGVRVSRAYGEITFDWVFQPDGSTCFD